MLSGNALNESAAKRSGFLVICMMLGIGAGFASGDIVAGMDGYTWLSRFHLTGTVIAMVGGGSLGLILGMVLDSKLTSARSRETVLGRLWAILFIGALLFLFFRPAFQAAR